MLKLKHISVVIAVLSVTACSTPIERRQPSGSFDYVNAEKQAPLVIPEGLKTPPYSKEYDIPKVGDKADQSLYGKDLDIRPPQQILPLAEGTHVEEGGDDIKIVVETIKGSTNLKQEMLSVVEGFLAKHNYKIVSEDKDKGIIQTDWIASSEVIDSHWISDDNVFSIRQRYEFDVEVRPHGRTGYLKIKVLDSHVDYEGADKELFLKGDDKRRFAIEMLNSATSYMSVERENIIRASKVAESKGIPMSFVAATDDKDSEGYWLVDAPLKRTWDRLALALPDVGLEIVDMDSSKGVYYLSFKDQTGFWDSFFGDKKMNIKDGNYRLVLTSVANDPSKTEIRFHDNEDQKINADKMKTVYDTVAAAMTNDRKVN